MIFDNHNIIVCYNNSIINEMINYFEIFMKINNKKIIGIDFEFNNVNYTRVIALFQINLHIYDGDKIVYMFYPPDLNKGQIYVLKELLYSNKVIIHGGESLDIPYLFSNIFTTNVERERFLKQIFDTRFLCEYYNIEFNKPEYKCKIYELLYQMKVIDDNKKKYLLDNEEKMGPIYKVIIDIRTISEEVIIYSAYDVIFLPDLLEKFPKTEIYQSIIPGITRNILLLRHNGEIIKNLSLLNEMNLFYIQMDEYLFQFVEMYNYMIEKLNSETIYNNIYSITFFRKYIQMITKFYLYKTFINTFKTYYKKNMINKHKITNDIYVFDINNFIKQYELKIINEFN